MDHFQRIVLCGDSVFLLSIESGLAALPMVETFRINPHLPDVNARIAAQKPNLILLEKGKNNSEITMAFLQENIPLILIDSNEPKITIISEAQVQKAELGDLVQIIQQWRPELPD